MAFDIFGNHRVMPGLEGLLGGVQVTIPIPPRFVQAKPIQKVTACSSHFDEDWVSGQCKFCGIQQCNQSGYLDAMQYALGKTE